MGTRSERPKRHTVSCQKNAKGMRKEENCNSERIKKVNQMSQMLPSKSKKGARSKGPIPIHIVTWLTVIKGFNTVSNERSWVSMANMKKRKKRRERIRSLVEWGNGGKDKPKRSIENGRQMMRERYVSVYCATLQRAAVCCNVLHCVALCCSVLQCGAEIFSELYIIRKMAQNLQCRRIGRAFRASRAWRRHQMDVRSAGVAACCILLQCVVVCCSAL